MHLVSPWIPRLAEGPISPSDRLVSALAEDILQGRLETGDRLPAHRDLADKLGIGVGTVTKAYGVLERRGLVRSVKGSGTFVALAQTRRGPLIDLSRNAPPAVMTERLIARTLASVAKRIDSGLFNDYPPLVGHDEHRRLLAQWFSGVGMDANPNRLVMTSGAHHGVSVALSVACGVGGTLFTEEQTYPGVIALARHQGVKLVGIAMDHEGMLPEALDRALASRRLESAALYVTPTMQNPTTATMERNRREEIVSVCRAHDLLIIEDDVYALTTNDSRPPLAMLAPERTFYVNSMSKTLNPTLRIGGLVAPDSMYERTTAALQATAIMVSPLSCAFMEQWLLDGTAIVVSQAIQEESRRRSELARKLLGGLIRKHELNGYHAWMPMSAQEAIRLEQAAKALGVMVTPPSSTSATPESGNNGVRLCLGSPSLNDLSSALGAVARLQNESSAPSSQLVL